MTATTPPRPDPLRPDEAAREEAVATPQRHRSLAAAIVSVAIFGITVGFSGPLFSLTLEARGAEASLTGLNAAVSYLGVVLGPLWAPRLVRRFGIRPFLAACLALDIVFFPAMKVFPSLGAWFVLRFLLGVVGSSLFTTAEAWINLLAGERRRGRVIGAYMATLSGGFALGPLLLALTGIAGWTPYVVTAGITALAALPLLGAGRLAAGLGREPAAGALKIFARAPFIVLAVGFYGVFESTAFALIPVWGVRIGLARPMAAALLSAMGLGAIALQLPIGWLSDKLARPAVLRLCGAAGLAGAVSVALLAAAGPLPLFVAMLLWGGLAAGIYPVALAMAGTRFRGAELVSANAAVIIAYGAGSLIGPTLGGVAMDLWNPHGLLAAFALLFALFLAMTVLGARRLSA
jgi:MFS family permease